ncbi:hypothetical protein HWV62_11972 [Athelia sp. TMB]|nr:hypothetical protein HWV62_11972 [Athelia sp. TMB]
MFSRGATPGKVRTWCYDEELEDFTADATMLDLWVLDQLGTLFQDAAQNATLDAELRDGKVVFFLHLLGLDTTGHSYRPHSKEYMHNIAVVDAVVRDAEKLVSDFYDPDNTRTPIIAWGKGIRGPLPDVDSSSHDEYSLPWDLGHLYRRDVEQADIAALMSTLIGINWPVNSVGVLPDVDPTRPGYLASAELEKTQAHAALVNAQVKSADFVLKSPTENKEPRSFWSNIESSMVQLKGAQSLKYKPYSPLESTSGAVPIRVAALAEIDKMLNDGLFEEARLASVALIAKALEGLQYLQTYDRVSIRMIVILAYTGWAAYASLYIFRPQIATAPLVTTAISSTILVGIFGYLSLQQSPWTFYSYVIFPWYFWSQIIIYTVFPVRNFLLSRTVDKTENLTSILLAGSNMILQGSISTYIICSARPKDLHLRNSFIVQLLFIAAAMGITASSITSLQAKNGLSIVNQVSGWHPSPSSRILSLFLGLGVCFVILSISVEGLFYTSLVGTLFLWVEVEAMLRGVSDKPKPDSTSYNFQVDDLRIAIFFLFFVQTAFFGTGNVASISSFYLEPVYRLVPIFNPFLMASLLIFKIIAPYVMLSVFFSALNSRLGLPPFSLFLVAVTLTDVMTITFFLNVTDTGSWLEIGQSITFFVIASLLLVWSAGICVIGEYLMADVLAASKVKED